MPEIVFRNKILNGSATDMCHCKPEFRSRSQEETAELVRRRSASILEVKEQVHQRLKEELLRAQSVSWALFHQLVFHCNSNSMRISFHSHLDSNIVIATKFCTCHDSTAVVACA